MEPRGDPHEHLHRSTTTTAAVYPDLDLAIDSETGSRKPTQRKFFYVVDLTLETEVDLERSVTHEDPLPRTTKAAGHWCESHGINREVE